MDAAVKALDRYIARNLLRARTRQTEYRWWKLKMDIKRQLENCPPNQVNDLAAEMLRQHLPSGERSIHA